MSEPTYSEMMKMCMAEVGYWADATDSDTAPIEWAAPPTVVMRAANLIAMRYGDKPYSTLTEFAADQVARSDSQRAADILRTYFRRHRVAVW